MGNTITSTGNTITSTYTFDKDIFVQALENYQKDLGSRKKIESKSHFSGYFEKGFLPNDVYIKEVMYYDPATIVFWSDGTKTVSKCREGDIYSEECGLLLCVMKKLIGANRVRELVKDWISYNDNIVTIKDVREKHR